MEVGDRRSLRDADILLEPPPPPSAFRIYCDCHFNAASLCDILRGGRKRTGDAEPVKFALLNLTPVSQPQSYTHTHTKEVEGGKSFNPFCANKRTDKQTTEG